MPHVYFFSGQFQFANDSMRSKVLFNFGHTISVIGTKYVSGNSVSTQIYIYMYIYSPITIDRHNSTNLLSEWCCIVSVLTGVQFTYIIYYIYIFTV